MSLSHYNPHTRYRDRAVQRFHKAMVYCLFVIIFVVIGFWIGRQYGAERLISLEEQVDTLTEQNNLLQDTVTEIRAEAQTANTRYEQIKAEYNAAIPEGPMQDIISLVHEQINGGMDPERLKFVIRSTRPPTGCTEPDTKRFVVSTPAYKGKDSAVSVADGTIAITGSGVSARNSKGQPEAWYDPAQSVTVKFTGGGVTETKKGTLPLRHSMIAGGREYRFTIEEGSRSFAKVIYDSCAYP